MFIQRIHFYGLLAVMFLAGAVIGTALDTMATGSLNKPKRVRISDIVQQVELTAEQRLQMDKVLEECRHRVVELNRDFRPEFEKIRHQTRADIRSVLTPEQRGKFDQLLEARDKERRDRDAKRQTSTP